MTVYLSKMRDHRDGKGLFEWHADLTTKKKYTPAEFKKHCKQKRKRK